jgi:hypothetical protein
MRVEPSLELPFDIFELLRFGLRHRAEVRLRPIFGRKRAPEEGSNQPRNSLTWLIGYLSKA